MMPLRAQGVRTVVWVLLRWWLVLKSNNVKKKVLFLTMGPPKLIVPWCVLDQSGSIALGTVPGGDPGGTDWFRLFPHELGSSAVLRTVHTALPVYLFVPERVAIWTVPLPRPISASTGARISLISPTRSGLIVVAELMPVG